MFRFRTSVLPALVGLYLLSALLHGGFSLSNVLNVLRIAIGVVLVGYGVRNWFRAVERSGRSLPINDVPDEGRNESTGFKKYYLVYLKYLVAAPLVSAFALWLLAFKVAGCEVSGASMQVYGCTGVGVALTHLQLYVMLFAAAMTSVLIPLTIVYLLVAVDKKSS